jgi:hypothetical protein
MGAWAHGGFDNDDALDFASELVAGQTWEPVSEALASVIEAEDGYVEAPEASTALAAAEVVAAAVGRPAAQLPAEVTAWVASAAAPEAELVGRARRAAERVLGDSELADLWGESPDSALWRREVEGLLGRLGAGNL